MKKALSFLLAAVLVISMIPASVFAEQAAGTVAINGAAFEGTLAEAVAAAVDGDVLTVSGTHNLTSEITVNKNISIVGDGTAVIDGGLEWSAVQPVADGGVQSLQPVEDTGVRAFVVPLNKKVTFSGLTIQNCSANQYGGAMVIYSEATIENCVFKKNVDFTGDSAAIRVDNGGAKLTITGTTFSENVYLGAGMYGCTVYIGGAVGASVTDCVFENNTSTQSAGITVNASTATISGCSFIGNEGGEHGCINTDNGSMLDISDCYFEGNEGGISIVYLVEGAKSTEGKAPVIDGCFFVNNTLVYETNRAAIIYASGPMIVQDCIFAGNSVSSPKGFTSVVLNRNSDVSGCVFLNNLVSLGVNNEYDNRSVGVKTEYPSTLASIINYFGEGAQCQLFTDDPDAHPIADIERVVANTTNVTYEGGVLKIDGAKVEKGGLPFVLALAPTTKVESSDSSVTADFSALIGSSSAVEDELGITEDDMDVLQDGGTVEIKLVAADTTPTADETAKIEELANFESENPDVYYIDLSVYKTVTATGGQSSETKLKELNDLVTIDVELPAELQGVDGLRVLRIHEGVAEELNTSANTYGEKFEIIDGGAAVRLTVRRFSVFAFTAEPAAQTPTVTPVVPESSAGRQNPSTGV